jgi:hypothetical protein
MTENIYTNATSTNMKKKLHHRMVPMMIYTEDMKSELILPMVVETSRELAEIESNAENDTREQLKIMPNAEQTSVSVWKQVMRMHRSAWLVYTCCRLSTDLTQKYFMNKQQVLDTYNPDELGILMDHYASVRYTQPHYTLLDVDSPTAFQDAIDKIKKMGTESDFFLNSFTTHSVNQLIKYLVSQLPNSENITGMSGTPSNNSTKTG